MKMWRFWLKPSEDNEELYHDANNYSLYACTVNKEFAKQFKEERDMSRFKVRKSEITQDEWSDFSRDNGDTVLSIRYLTTKKVLNKKGRVNVYETPILCTNFEYQTADSDYASINIASQEWWNEMPPHLAFNKKIRKALQIIKYDSLFKLISEKGNTFISDTSEIPYPDVSFDEVGIFLDSFSGTF